MLDGEWQAGTSKILYLNIITESWNTRYSNNWEKYL